MIAVDTNILVYAHRKESRHHTAARDHMRALAEGPNPWAIPWPCFYEFFSVVTLMYSRNMKTDGDLSDDRCQPRVPFLSRIGAITLLFICLAVTGSSRAEPSNEAEVAIQHLLNYVHQSDLVFVRNFSNHSSADAAEHISEKYDHFREKIATPEDFIDLCASKSLLTGKAYLVIDDQGREIATRDWLLIELAAYRTRNGQVNK